MPVGSNFGSEQEAASSVPNIVPAPIQAPGGATTIDDVKRQNSTLHAVWQCGADGKLERIAMNIILKENKKFNRDIRLVNIKRDFSDFGGSEISNRTDRVGRRLKLQYLFFQNVSRIVWYIKRKPTRSYFSTASNFFHSYKFPHMYRLKVEYRFSDFRTSNAPAKIQKVAF